MLTIRPEKCADASNRLRCNASSPGTLCPKCNYWFDCLKRLLIELRGKGDRLMITQSWISSEASLDIGRGTRSTRRNKRFATVRKTGNNAGPLRLTRPGTLRLKRGDAWDSRRVHIEWRVSRAGVCGSTEETESFD